MPQTERCDGDSRDLAQRLVDVDFSFVPTDLSDRSRQLIESYHGVHGNARLADLLWHPEMRAFIARHRELSPELRKASTSRSARQSNQGYVLIAATLLSLEILASNFAGWGKRHPVARLAADAILGAHLPNSRSWLMDFYFYQRRRSVDRVIVETMSPAPARRQGGIAMSDRTSRAPLPADGLGS